MMLDLLKELILDFQNQVLDTGIKRHLKYEPVRGKAFVCIGVRRCGKSTLLYQIIEDLRRKGINNENILYINFFDDRLMDIKHGNLSLVTEAYYSMFPEKKGTERIYCFFDEIQEAENWEPFIDRLLRTEKCDVFITGSSSKMLTREVATQMRGRSVSWELFPFSFKEYAAYKKVDYNRLTSKNRMLLRKCFDEYLEAGGFPEVRDVSAGLRLKIHQEYYKTILHRDIIERYNAIHPQAVIRAGHRLISTVGSLYSINRITAYLKSMGYKVSKGFVSECIEWFEDAYFLFTVKIFSQSAAIQNVNAKKIYSVDHALIKAVTSGISSNAGHLLENIVFLHIRRHTEDLYYYRTQKATETDFVWFDDQGNKHLVQACFSLRDPLTKKREVSALLQAMDELDLKAAVIVTLEEEDAIEKDDRKINIIPIWKYLVQDEGNE